MTNDKLAEIRNGFETAYMDRAIASNLAYKPQFVSNNYKEGRKVLSSIEDELLVCDRFQISVAFITVRRQITIGHNSKLNFRLTSIRPRGLTGNCTFLSA